MELEKKVNRRRAFRIYEHVDLFYQTIEYAQDEEAKLNFNDDNENAGQPRVTSNTSFSDSPTFDSLLPDSQSQENDTLNINISSSGLSFTCNEKLMTGDLLMVRVLLLSSMTVIMTCCKVVYTKSSNPYENDQYPYLVGAHFVNLTVADKQLLDRYINKKRRQHLFVNGLAISLAMTFLAIPDVAFDLLLDLCSFLFDNFLELIHILYEVIEFSVDHLIESIFHTDVQDTQVIGFYIQVALGLAGLYAIVGIILSMCKSLLYRSHVFYRRKKSSLLYRWGELTWLTKIAAISLGITVISCYILYLI